MKVKTITKYVANDGKEFENSTDCIYHESKQKPIIINNISSEKLSNLIWEDWEDSECSEYDNRMWSEYLQDKVNVLQSIYDIFAKENETELLEFVKKFDYYTLGDVIAFLDLLRIDVNK